MALFRYTLAILLHSQRYLPPTLLYCVVAMLLVHGDNAQPVAPIFGVMTVATLVLAAWLTVSLIGVEDPVQRTITAVNAGRSRSLLIATAWVVLACCAVLSALLLAVPLVFGFRDVTGLELFAGAEALLTGACVGVAIGLVTSRLMIRRPGYGLLTTLLLLLLFVLVRWIPPVNPAMTLLTRNGSVTGDTVASATGYAAVAVVLMALSVAATQLVAARRD
ncbi:hypothetical protein [Actinophytocola oryzae]|uniref:ABC-2 family transporter n=1 Tax=Actinophytocola oryzae TaxID=502181 RepID=A0A4R7V2K0_9PSEU|nr:hypothetical protein [Actinophytocola oryzae]TDV43070.1 hypothetical protein CLV71_1164 [Actinophytocola oryzae]